MTNINFDDFVKKEFGGYSPAVPDHIWDRIADEREKKKPKGFWFSLFNGRNLLLLLGLIAASVAGTWMYHSNSNKNDQPISSNTANSNRNKENTGNNKTSIESSAIQSNPTGDPASTENIVANNTGTVVTPKEADPEVSSNYSPLPSSYRGLQPGGKPTNTNRFNLNNSGFKVSVDKNEADGVDNAFNDALNNIEKNTGTDNARNLNSLPAGGTLMGRLLYGAEKINARSPKTKLLFDKKPAVVGEPKCPRFDDPAGNKQYFELYAGPDLALLSFSDTANSAYLQKRKETEKFSSAFSAGLRYTRVFNNGISLRTGVNYSQINEKFSYQKGGIIQYVYIIDQATGDTIGSYTITGTRYKTTYNRYRTIDIPLQLGYEMGNGRLHYNIGAGVMVNVYSWQRGDVLDGSLQPVNITTGKSSSPYGYKTNIGVGFIGSFTAYYKLTDRLHLLAEPYFRYNLRPISKDNLTLTQKYNTTGLRIGFRLDLQ